jgi:preprotein translocase subunit SecA
LEDDLMRKFGSERIAKLMDRMGLKEGEVITAGMVSKSIERAQKKVEENNFGVRKRLLEYDDVMNAQRKAIYKKRRNALFGDRLDIDVDNMFFELCDTTVRQYGNLPFEEFEIELIRVVGIDSPVDASTFATLSKDDLVHSIYTSMREQYDRKCEKIATRAMPQIIHVQETMSDRYKNIVFPLTDGRSDMELIVNLEEAYNSNGKTISKSFEKNIILSKIDDEWKEHLREMDDLRSAVNNATYEQKDPLVVYKLESYELFRSMMNRLNEGAVEMLMNLDMPIEQQLQSTNQEAKQSNYEKAQISGGNTSSTTPPQFSGRQGYQQAIENSFPQEEKRQPVIAEPKVGRNDLCPCGSGKKYKQCHGK